jgi:tetratricopeptide (TPR) repeat protein
MVGRGHDLAELEAALDNACAGTGSLVLVTGEAGIGKTRLVEELARSATSRGAVVAWGSCWEAAGAPALWPWIQVLRACLRETDSERLDPLIAAAAPELALVLPEIADRLPALARTTEGDEARFRLFDAVSRFLTAASTVRPVLVAIDDLHWADRSSLLLLEFLSRTARSWPLLVVGTSRAPDEHPESVVHNLSSTTRRIALTGLAHDDVRALVETIIGVEPAVGLVRAVLARTAGNPFFVRELVRLLHTQGRLGDPWSAPIPDTVRDVLDRRLARLHQTCHELLQMASVIGLEFSLDALEALAGGAAVAELQPAIEARLVEAVPDEAGRYRFAHALFREALYEGLGPVRRATLHADAGRALEALPATSAAELAHHFVQAGDAARTARWARDAGDEALARRAYDEAATHYDLALRGLSADDDTRCDLLLARGRALNAAGDSDAARDAFRAAASLAGTDPERLAAAALGFGHQPSFVTAGDVDDELVGMLEEALALLGAGDSALTATVMARLGWDLYYWDWHRANALARDAVAMARRIQDPVALGYALRALRGASLGFVPLDERVTMAEEMIDLGETSGDRELTLWGRIWRVCDLAESGDRSAAEAEMTAFERAVRRLRIAAFEWWPALWKGMRAVLEGRLDDAERLALEAVSTGQRAHGPAAVTQSALILFSAMRERGRYTELEHALVAMARDVPRNPFMHVAQPWFAAVHGRLDEAREGLLRAAADDFALVPENFNWTTACVLLAEACVLTGERTVAAALYERFRPYAGRCVVLGYATSFGGTADATLGSLAAVLERWNDAEAHFRDALALEGRLGARPAAARTRFELARMLLARADPDDEARARMLLDEALAAAEAIGMERLATDARALRARTDPSAAGECLFRRDDEVWTIGFAGVRSRLRDSKGMRDLATLLARPGDAIPAAELAGSSVVDGDTGPILDERARAEYRSRLADLHDDVDEAEAMNDAARAERARAEIAAITDQLSSAFGLGGRRRKTVGASERARTAVTMRIRAALDRIEEANPSLGRHLRRAVKTGTFCSYAPDEPVRWTLS